MDKKQIGMLAIIGILVIALTVGITYFLLKPKSESKSSINNKSEIKVGNYTIKYGKYVGVSEEYNPDTDSVDKKEVYLTLTETMIKIDDNTQTYKVVENKIITSSSLEYEVIGNNRIMLLAGGGVEYKYEG